MNIAAAVVAPEYGVFLVLPSTWLSPTASCTLRRVLQTLKPALNSCELQSLSAMCDLDIGPQPAHVWPLCAPRVESGLLLVKVA